MENPQEHFSGHVAQKAFIERGGKILLVKSPGDSKWDIPGGRIHKGEQPKQAVEREILEELGVGVTVEKPVFVGLTRADSTGEERYFVAFKTTLQDPSKPFVLQEDEVADVRWVSKEEVETIPIFDVCREAVRTYFSQ